MDLTLEEIKKREKKFALANGFYPKDKKQAEFVLEGSFHKLVEEVGEVSTDLLIEDYEKTSEELADVVIYCVKISSMLEKFHKQKSLSEAVDKKMKYNETRKTFNRGTTKIKCQQ